jgi:copper(I)-binding protein
MRGHGPRSWTSFGEFIMPRIPRPGRAAAALSLAFALVVAALPVSAHDYTLGDLKIGHPWSRATPPSAKVGAGYLSIANRGGAPDRLVSAVSSVAGRVEIHEMKMDAGVMRMRELAQGLALPAGETVALRPGGYHLMLMDLRAPLREGTPVPVTLVFERAGRIEVELKVEAPTARQSGHGDHGAGHAAPAGPHKHSH